jgi:hypothetical protein
MPCNDLCVKFPFLVPKEGRSKTESIIGKYGRAKIVRERWIIIWNGQNKHFYLFKCRRDLIAFLAEQDKLEFYEVIFAEAKQRLKIDIDGGTIEGAEEVKKIVKRYVGARGWPVIVCDSSSGPGKISRHIIVDHWYSGATAVKSAVMAIVERVKEKNVPTKIDETVYKNIQYFRLTGSSKPGKPPKTIVTPGIGFEQTLIGWYKR